MPKFESLEDWIDKKWVTQGALGEKLGVASNTVSQWVSGKSRIKPPIQKKLRDLGYDGPFPEQGGQVTTATLEAMQANIISRMDWVREEVRKENAALAEALDLILKHLGIELKPKH